MTNPPKQRGTAAETAVVKAAHAHGIPARRVALAGNQDQGDVHLWDGAVVIEVKSRRTHPSWTDVDKWWREAEAEAHRVDDCDAAVLVIKRPGSGYAGDWFAWVTVGDLLWWTADRATDLGGTSTQRVMMPLGDLLALLKAGAPDGT